MQLGFDPDDLTVNLFYGAGFYQTLESNKPWPDGVALVLEFATSSKTATAAFTWAATFDTVFATWVENAAAVQAVLDAGATYARLLYTDAAGEPIGWATGRVNAA